MAMPQNRIEIGKNFVTIDGIQLLVDGTGVEVKRDKVTKGIEVTLTVYPQTVEHTYRTINDLDAAERQQQAANNIHTPQSPES